MKKLIIIAIMAIGAFGTIEAQAQYVEKISGKIYIDVQDMPTGSWSNSSLNSDHNENSTTNTLYKRFQVGGSDEALNLTWDAAKLACAAKGAGWRLPTLKELTLIYLLNNVLQLASLNPLASTPYWSSTINSVDSNSFWVINMLNGIIGIQNKTFTLCRVRCVREV